MFFQSFSLATFIKLLIVYKVLPHPFDLHNCTANSEEQEPLGNWSKRQSGLSKLQLLINGKTDRLSGIRAFLNTLCWSLSSAKMLHFEIFSSLLLWPQLCVPIVSFVCLGIFLWEFLGSMTLNNMFKDWAPFFQPLSNSGVFYPLLIDFLNPSSKVLIEVETLQLVGKALAIFSELHEERSKLKIDNASRPPTRDFKHF